MQEENQRGANNYKNLRRAREIELNTKDGIQKEP